MDDDLNDDDILSEIFPASDYVPRYPKTHQGPVRRVKLKVYEPADIIVTSIDNNFHNRWSYIGLKDKFHPIPYPGPIPVLPSPWNVQNVDTKAKKDSKGEIPVDKYMQEYQDYPSDSKGNSKDVPDAKESSDQNVPFVFHWDNPKDRKKRKVKDQVSIIDSENKEAESKGNEDTQRNDLKQSKGDSKQSSQQRERDIK